MELLLEVHDLWHNFVHDQSRGNVRWYSTESNLVNSTIPAPLIASLCQGNTPTYKAFNRVKSHR